MKNETGKEILLIGKDMMMERRGVDKKENGERHPEDQVEEREDKERNIMINGKEIIQSKMWRSPDHQSLK